MKIVLLAVGNTEKGYLQGGVNQYINRIRHYISFDLVETRTIKKTYNLSKKELIDKEGVFIQEKIKESDYVVLLDCKGKQYSSLEFANQMQLLMNSSKKRIIFIIGGAYGFSKDIYQRANKKLSLSLMTFSHQMVRLFFVEQIYRAYTILNNQPYHNQ